MAQLEIKMTINTGDKGVGQQVLVDKIKQFAHKYSDNGIDFLGDWKDEDTQEKGNFNGWFK